MGIGLGDQAIQQRVIEHPPPLADVRAGPLLAGLLDGRAAPLLDPGLAGRLEVRAQTHTTAQAECAEQEQAAWAKRGRHGAGLGASGLLLADRPANGWPIPDPLPEQRVTDRNSHPAYPRLAG
ncbi:hypothetical protein D3C78_1487580 [compost metagenome]